MNSKMGSVVLYFIYFGFFVLCSSTLEGVDPLEPQFEAAFQGRCGRGSPCAELCRELHDGTYECGCRPGHVLHVDGYSCQEINSTSKWLSENYIDSEEDVLYQKDASFSAELDVALLPAKDAENDAPRGKTPITTTEPVVLTTTPKRFPSPYDFFSNGFNFIRDIENNVRNDDKKNNGIKQNDKIQLENIDHQRIKGTPLYSRSYLPPNAMNIEHLTTKDPKQSDEHENVLLAPVVESVREDVGRMNDPYRFKLYKEIEGLNSLKAEGLSSKDIDMIANAELDGAANRKPMRDDDMTLVTTTLGPSLEQKVPPMSTSGPGHTESSPRSGCPLGRMGPNCDKVAPPVSMPRFSGSGWLALPALRGAYKRVRLRVHFRPSARDGLLLLTGERADMAGDYLALVLRRGYVELIFDCGSGPGIVRSDSPVLPNQWNTLTLYRRRWDAWLQLNGGRHVQGRSKGLFSRMTFLEPVFLGGAGNMSGLSRLPVQGGFSGCVRSLEINGREYRFQARPKGDSLDGYAVGECGSLGCSKSCLHGGKCMKHCLCPLGYAGDYCEIQLDLQVPRFNGSSFLRYRGLGETALSWLELQITLKAGANSGLVMYNSHRADGAGDYFALYLKNGHVEFAFDLGTGQSIIRSSKKIDLQEWYTVNVSRTGRLAILTVISHSMAPENDGDVITASQSSQGLTSGAFTQLSLSQNLYLGGLPQYRMVQKRIGINESFTGCIQKVVINDHEMSIVSSALGGVNVDGCPHACVPGACGEASCRPRLHHYTCVCSPGIKSEKCTIFLNETSEPHVDDYSTNHSSPHGQLEKVHYIPYKLTNSSIHRGIVPKKGPKPYKYFQFHDEIKDDIYYQYATQAADLSIEIENPDVVQTEWILSDKKGSKDNTEQNIRNSGLYIGGLPKDDKQVIDEDKKSWMKSNRKKGSKNIDIDHTVDIPRFTGYNSFIRITDPLVLERLSSHSVDINIRFRSQASEGLLLWLGKDGMAPGETFMGLGVEDGLLTFRYDAGNGEVIIRANQTKVDDGLWHRARAVRKGQSGVLEIDGLGAVGKASPGRMRPLNTDSGLYIGGMSSIWPETVGRYNSGLKGCISKLILDRDLQIPINFSSHEHKTLRNVDKCPP